MLAEGGAGQRRLKVPDTNVFARLLLGDDPKQAVVAREIVDAGVLLIPTVLLELGWLLGSRYRFSRAQVVDALQTLLDLPGVLMAGDFDFSWMIGRYEQGGGFADLVHVASAASADSFATFDAKVKRQAGPETPVPIETLTT